jgi:hypothetical protein
MLFKITDHERLALLMLFKITDHERLALLKEVAGTRVYEQRRAESLRIMADTDAKRGKSMSFSITSNRVWQNSGKKRKNY